MITWRFLGLVLGAVGTILGSGIYTSLGFNAQMNGKYAPLGYLVSGLCIILLSVSTSKLMAMYPTAVSIHALLVHPLGMHVSRLVSLIVIYELLFASCATAGAFGNVAAEAGLTDSVMLGILCLIGFALCVSRYPAVSDTCKAIAAVAECAGLVLLALCGIAGLLFWKRVSVTVPVGASMLNSALQALFAYGGLIASVSSIQASAIRGAISDRERQLVLPVASAVTAVLYTMCAISVMLMDPSGKLVQQHRFTVVAYILSGGLEWAVLAMKCVALLSIYNTTAGAMDATITEISSANHGGSPVISVSTAVPLLVAIVAVLFRDFVPELMSGTSCFSLILYAAVHWARHRVSPSMVSAVGLASSVLLLAATVLLVDGAEALKKIGLVGAIAVTINLFT